MEGMGLGNIYFEYENIEYEFRKNFKKYMFRTRAAKIQRGYRV